MILLGCLLAMGLAVAPRLVLVLAWIFSDRWSVVWSGNWVAPLLGIIFLPYTTVMYVLLWKPEGIQGWDWIWIGLGLFLDLTHWMQSYANRKQVPGYPTPPETGPEETIYAGPSTPPTMAAVAASPGTAAVDVAPAVRAPIDEDPPASGSPAGR
jgi:hypothetical protein